jgi:hypothetical protein
VEEQIFVRSSVDKSKALFRQFLNRTFSHFVQLPKKCVCGVALTNMVRLLHRECAIVARRLHCSYGWRSSRPVLACSVSQLSVVSRGKNLTPPNGLRRIRRSVLVDGA